LVGLFAPLFKRNPLGMPIHFLHIGKTGGTAIAEALSPVAQQFGIVMHAHDTKLSDVPRDDRVFFFVRHPVSRFVSGFFSRLRRGAPRYNYEWNEAEAKAFGRFQKANDLAEALSATDRATLMRAREAMNGIQHVNSVYRNWFFGEQELTDRLDSILLLGLQEKLRSDFEHLKWLLKLPKKVSLPDDDVRAHRTPGDFDRRLSPLAQRNLSEWYAEDIRFYERCLQLRARQGL
jgi:Sulfotransferase family